MSDLFSTHITTHFVIINMYIYTRRDRSAAGVAKVVAWTGLEYTSWIEVSPWGTALSISVGSTFSSTASGAAKGCALSSACITMLSLEGVLVQVEGAMILPSLTIILGVSGLRGEGAWVLASHAGDAFSLNVLVLGLRTEGERALRNLWRRAAKTLYQWK
jgi:hypothetical protein